MVDLDVVNAYWRAFIFACSVVIFCSAFFRYREKKSDISKILVVAFFFFMIALMLEVIASFLSLTGFELLPASWGNPAFLRYWGLNLLINHQFSYMFLVLGLLYLFHFAFSLSSKETEKPRLFYLAWVFALCVIGWGAARVLIALPTEPDYLVFLTMMDPYVVFFCLLMSTPIVRQGHYLLKRVPKSDERYPKIRFMTVMGISLFLMTLGFILETLYGILTGIWVNIFTFLGFGFALISILMAYASFYRRS